MLQTILSRYAPALRNRLLFLVIANMLMLAFIFAATQRHPDASFSDELSRLGPNIAPLLLAGFGLTGIVMTGAIDLSIGAMVAMSGTVLGILFYHGAPPIICFAGCLVTSVLLSITNGLLVQWLRIPAIIITLAGLTAYRGLALVVADITIGGFTGHIAISGDAYQSPGKLYAGWIGGLGLLVAITWELCGKTTRTWLALGNSPVACRLRGLSDRRILMSAFAVGGVFHGLAALTDVTNSMSIEPNRLALGFELEVIAALVLGGTNIFGGEGSYAGTALGGLFLYLVSQTMLYAGVGESWRTAVEGALIIAVIGFDCVVHRRRKSLEELR